MLTCCIYFKNLFTRVFERTWTPDRTSHVTYTPHYCMVDKRSNLVFRYRLVLRTMDTDQRLPIPDYY